MKIRQRSVPLWSGLRGKIIGWFLVPTAIILGAVAALTFTASRQVTAELAATRTQDRAQLLAGQLSADLSIYEQRLGAVVSELYDHPLAALGDAVGSRWPVGDLQVFDAGVLVLDPDGAVVGATAGLTEMVGRRFPGPGAGANLALETVPGVAEHLGLTNILFDAVPGMDVIALVQAFRNLDNEPRGFVVGLFQAERTATRGSTFYRRIWELYIGRRLSAETSEIAFVVDGNGHIVFHPDTFLIGEDFSGHQAVRLALRGEVGAVRAEDHEGNDVIAGYSPVARTPWVLVTEEAWSAITLASRPYIRFMLGLLVLGAAIPVIAVALGVRRITRPLERLTEAAEAVAGGDFSQSIAIHTGDELEMLAEQFNTMALELQASYANLEQRVADRTRELATLNAVASVVSRSLEIDEVMEAALGQTLSAMDLEAGAAFRLDESGETLRLMAHHGFPETFIAEVESLPIRASLAAQARESGLPVIRPVRAYPPGPLRRLLELEGITSVISVPLLARDELLGVLNLVSRTERTLTQEEQSLLASIGQQTGLALENARLYEEAERTAAATERNRLARELHDAVSQTLFTASLIADVLPQLWERDPKAARAQLDTLGRLTRGAMAEMRTLLLELRPAALLETDLSTLLDHLSRAVAGRADLEVDLMLAEVAPPPPEIKVALYRIAQEALNNVVKHARAERITVSLHEHAARRGAAHCGAAPALEIHICDDGRGFDPADVPPDHFGLMTMRERAEAIGARLTVESGLGQGTCVSVVWTGEPACDTASA